MSQVALKKIENVGRSSENARKVLREVCILRRLQHPHIITLHDVFWQPSPTGALPLICASTVRHYCDASACVPMMSGPCAREPSASFSSVPLRWQQSGLHFLLDAFSIVL